LESGFVYKNAKRSEAIRKKSTHIKISKISETNELKQTGAYDL